MLRRCQKDSVMTIVSINIALICFKWYSVKNAVNDNKVVILSITYTFFINVRYGLIRIYIFNSWINYTNLCLNWNIKKGVEALMTPIDLGFSKSNTYHSMSSKFKSSYFYKSSHRHTR